MSVGGTASAYGQPSPPPASASRIPASIWVIALLVALIHLAPYWRAQRATPPDWTFTWNLKASPDFMQYRVWARRTLDTGVLVDNNFTAEPNPPHLPVVLYYTLGRLSAAFDTTPEHVDAYAGAAFGFALTVILFVTARRFLPPAATWWVFGALLLGGGLGAHLKLLSGLELVRQSHFLKGLIVDSLPAAHVFDDYRGSYIVTSLFDAHYLLLWSSATLAVLALHSTLRRFSAARVLLTAGLFAAVTVLHVYEGATLLLIALGISVACWRKDIAVRAAALTLGAAAVAVGAVLVWLWLLYRASGLPVSSWRGEAVVFSTLLLSYPLAWAVIVWGGRDYWQRAGFNECFLVGWAAGCLAEVVSGPFYPYAHRGTLTLQIPLFLIAGTIYFARHTRITITAAAVTVLLLGATPFNVLRYEWRQGAFSPTEPYMFLGPDHRAMLEVLRQQAHADDVLLVDTSTVGWRHDALWLAPEFPGRHYCGHFFLTVDFPHKRAKAAHFFRATPEEQAAFLRDEKIRFVFVSPDDDPPRFARVPGLRLLKATPVGSLFEYGNAAT